MHILIAVHGYPPLQNAGAEKAAERIADWLVAQGHDVEVFALNPRDHHGAALETRSHNGMTIHRLSLDLRSNDRANVMTYNNPQVGQVFGQILAGGSLTWFTW